MILIIGLFYLSLHSNPRNPPIKAFIFSLLMFFGFLRLPEGKGEKVKAQSEVFFMLSSGEGSK